MKVSLFFQLVQVELLNWLMKSTELHFFTVLIFSPESNLVRAKSSKVLTLALDTSLEVTKREFRLTPHLILRFTHQLPLGVYNCKTCPPVIDHDHKQPRSN